MQKRRRLRRMEANGNGHVLRSQPNDRKHSGPFNMIIDDARTRDRKRFVPSKNVETGSLSLGRVLPRTQPAGNRARKRRDLSPEDYRAMYRGAIVNFVSTRSHCSIATHLLLWLLLITFEFSSNSMSCRVPLIVNQSLDISMRNLFLVIRLRTLRSQLCRSICWFSSHNLNIMNSDAFLKLISTTIYLLSFGHFEIIADSDFYRSSKKISSWKGWSRFFVNAFLYTAA